MNFLLIAAFSVTILSSCASYTQNTKKMHSAFYSGNYQEALTQLNQTELKEQKRNRLLYRLEHAMILDRLGEREASRKLLLEAATISEELYTVSVSSQATSFLVSDSQADYEGEDFEKVTIHTMLALSFLADKQFDAARIEAKKINTRLAQITEGHDPKHNHYSEDGFSRFLAGLIYEAKGQIDDAIVDYRKALVIYESSNYRQFYRGPTPPALIQALYRVAKMKKRRNIIASLRRKYPKRVKQVHADHVAGKTAKVVIIHEVGNVARKRTKEFVLGFGHQITRFSYPYIADKNRFFGLTGAKIDGSFVHADNLANFSQIAYWSLEDRRGRMLLKSAARLIAKGQINKEARRQFGPLGGLLVNIFTVATETADTRSWTLLPGAISVTALSLKPGTHQLEIKNDNRLASLRSVTLKAGELLILRDIGS